MNQADLPLWMEVARAIGPTGGSLLVFAAALTAATIAWKTYRQRKAADELSYRQRKEADEQEEKAAIGLAALDLLQVSSLATSDDRRLINTLYRQIIAARTARVYTRTIASAAEQPRPRRTFPWTRRGE